MIDQCTDIVVVDKVLVADDDPSVRRYLRDLLELDGFAVVEAADGVSALAALREHDIDVVLLDVTMPGTGGLTVLAHMRSDPALAGVPALLVTSDLDGRKAINGLELGADDYVRKPFDGDELIARVSRAAARKHERDQLQRANAALAQQVARLERTAAVDPITGLANRRAIEATVRAYSSAARRHATPIGVLMIDVDHFKRVNDTLGHDAGDTTLRSVAACLKSSLRGEDAVGRWGGDEFLAVLPATDLSAAETAAQRICTALAQLAERDARHVGLTVSIGCAAGFDADAERLVDQADQALYAAKEAGRNRVSTAAR